MIALNGFVSSDRIQIFLNEHDIDDSKSIFEISATIGFKEASFEHYNSESSESGFKLRALSASFPLGSLSLICGPVGSGKSSLLLALLGELRLTGGKVLRPEISSFSYVPQTAWLLNATVKDNILFGQRFDQSRYNSVIIACALKSDLALLKDGDMTEIGEKGVALSGGQKQRISLARACYSSASIFLLDDPLSAVDPPTAVYILQNCILGLLKGRTILLVSHAASLVSPFADFTMCMEGGRLISSNFELVPSSPDTQNMLSNLDQMKSTTTVHRESSNEETQAVGSVSFELYIMYLLTGSLLFLLFYTLSYIFSTAAKLAHDLWLKKWTETVVSDIQLSFLAHYSSLPGKLEDEFYYVKVYALFGIAIIAAETFQTVIFLLGSWFASARLHDRLLSTVLRSPLRFFEITPIGRILNRFSKDIDTIDTTVMTSIRRLGQRVTQVLTTIVFISYATPVFLGFTPFIVFFFFYIANRYLKVSRELKRFESTTRSPIFAQFSETLAGATTIREYGASERFITACNRKVDLNHRPYFFVWASNRWLSIRTDIMSAIIVFVSGCAIILSHQAPGVAALVIGYSLELSDSLLWAVRTHAELEMSMNSGKKIK